MIDEQTGFPVLPEGFFWRVTRGVWSEYVYLQIRRRRLIGSVRHADSILRKSEVTPAKLRYSAGRCLEEFDPSGAKHKAFVGDYPPKRLRS